MTKRIYLDVETSSKADLTKVGSAAYFAHPTTRLNCLVFAVDDGPLLFVPYEECYPGSPLNGLAALLCFNDYVLVCHNAEFEKQALKACLNLHIPPEKFICTMAKAGYYGYPRSLDKMTQALGTSVLKDIQGSAVMKKLCKGQHTPQTAPEDFQRLYVYCAHDVESMRQADKLMPDLPPNVQELWVLNAEINAHGVPIDLRTVNNAIALKEYLKEQADLKMSAITGGVATTVGQIDKIHTWLISQGVNLVDLTADTVARTLDGPLPPAVREVLLLRQGAGLSSLSKYDKMLAYQVNGRLHNMEDFYGAHTGRATANGPQLKNLPRTLEADMWSFMLREHSLLLLAIFGENAAKKMKEALRGVIRAPGEDGDLQEKWLIGADLSQIEARAVGYLANCQQFLKLFEAGRDPYCEYGYNIFGRKITKADLIPRTASKATVLSFGFAGGIGAGQIGAELYNLDLNILVGIILPTATPAELTEGERNVKYYLDKRPDKPLTHDQALAVDILKQRYRADFPEITNYWDELENTFLIGGWAGRVHVDVRAGGLRVVTLPSGRQLFYHGVESDGKSYSYQGRHGKVNLWKGILIQNLAEAVNEDCISHFKLLARKHIGPIIHTCYDEFTCEILRSQLESATKMFKEIMATTPAGYEGLPLAYDMWDGKNYG